MRAPRSPAQSGRRPAQAPTRALLALAACARRGAAAGASEAEPAVGLGAALGLPMGPAAVDWGVGSEPAAAQDEQGLLAQSSDAGPISAPCRFCKEPRPPGLPPARRAALSRGGPPGSAPARGARAEAQLAAVDADACYGLGLTPLQFFAAASCGSVLAIFCVTGALAVGRPRRRGWAALPGEGSWAEDSHGGDPDVEGVELPAASRRCSLGGASGPCWLAACGPTGAEGQAPRRSSRWGASMKELRGAAPVPPPLPLADETDGLLGG
ncbi:unnamed protein product, partial [Prorocentrum cordatum]